MHQSIIFFLLRRRGDVGPIVPTRIVGPEFLVKRAYKLWHRYIPACLESTYDLLGPQPFSKLDIVIVPRSYSGLGLASPSLMFISQSLVNDGSDKGMDIRIAHEISHNYFGLVIGALDWTEEWLSEVKFSDTILSDLQNIFFSFQGICYFCRGLYPCSSNEETGQGD